MSGLPQDEPELESYSFDQDLPGDVFYIDGFSFRRSQFDDLGNQIDNSMATFHDMDLHTPPAGFEHNISGTRREVSPHFHIVSQRLVFFFHSSCPANRSRAMRKTRTAAFHRSLHK